MKNGTKEEALLKALDELEAATVNKADDSDSKSSSVSEEEDDDSKSSGSKKVPPFMKKGEKIPSEMKNKDGGNGMPKVKKDGDFESVDASEGEPTMKTNKSLSETVDGDETLQKSFEVSDFLKSFSDVMVEAQETSTNAILKSLDEQQDFNEKVQKALVEMGSMLTEMRALITEQGEQPVAGPKTTLSKGDVSERFAANAPQYSPQQVAAALTDMAMKGECDTVAVSAYETTQYLPENLHGQVNQRLRVMYGGRQ